MASTESVAATRAAEAWVVYVLRCAGDRLYCGIAKDVDARYAEHVAGKGAKFTRAFPPSAVVAVVACDGRSAALRTEAAFKALSRAAKLRTITAWQAGEGGDGQEQPT